MFKPFVQDVINWLSIHEKNVAVVHCKAGKGRTGVMICAYLMASGLVEGAQDAMRFYGAARTKNQKVSSCHFCNTTRLAASYGISDNPTRRE